MLTYVVTEVYKWNRIGMLFFIIYFIKIKENYFGMGFFVYSMCVFDIYKNASNAYFNLKKLNLFRQDKDNLPFLSCSCLGSVILL